MFAFHAVGRQEENFLKSDDERLKDFRARLQYLARGVQVELATGSILTNECEG